MRALYSVDDGINENVFHEDKRLINIAKVNIKEIVLSDEEPYGNKYSYKHFIEYIHKGEALPAPLCIKCRQMKAYV